MSDKSTSQSGSWFKQNIPLVIIVGMLLTVLIGAQIFKPRTDEARARLIDLLGTKNNGVLLNPLVSINELEMKDANGAGWQLEQQKVKWRYLIPLQGKCREACRRALYLTRQVHVRLDKKASRVERILLNLDNSLDVETREWLASEHRYLKILDGSLKQFDELLEDTNAHLSETEPGIYVVDQAGLIMMFYPGETEGVAILEDIKHLLKYSPEP